MFSAQKRPFVLDIGMIFIVISSLDFDCFTLRHYVNSKSDVGEGQKRNDISLV